MVFVDCLSSRSPGQATYGARSACAKRAAYPDPPPRSPSPRIPRCPGGLVTVTTFFRDIQRRRCGSTSAQAQHRRLWRSRTPNARSLSHSPSSPPPSFTQSPFPPRSLVRDGQTSPHRPRLVVSFSTCAPLSPSPHANSFVIGTARHIIYRRLRLLPVGAPAE
jgi:hypothetical protein